MTRSPIAGPPSHEPDTTTALVILRSKATKNLHFRQGDSSGITEILRSLQSLRMTHGPN
jgi:hypothetical protein